jgi:hypothetical protein
MSFLRPLNSLVRMFHGLLGMLMPTQMISLTVTGRGRPMRVRSLFVKLSSPLVRIVRHILLPRKQPNSNS